jgi:formylmethanofuran dehydrogenase subunit B
VVCLGCGCTCDDIALRVDGDRIVEARRACAMGMQWFGDGRAPSRSRKAGTDCGQDEALDEMARTLAKARRPLIYLAPDMTCEAQRQGVALADLLRGSLDSVTSDEALSFVLAGQVHGRASATLGEVRNRADLVVFWGTDPEGRAPRFAERYAPGPVGVHLPDGRRSRIVVAVDIGGHRAAADADVRVSMPARDEVTSLVTLAAALGSSPSRAAGTSNDPGAIGDLAARIRAARYVVIVADVRDVPSSSIDEDQRAEALTLLSLAVNDATRGALVTLRGGGNRAGAETVITSQTGYPLAIDFRRGSPEYQPWSGRASSRLSNGDADVVLVLGALSGVPPSVTALLPRATTLVIGPRASESGLAHVAASVDTGVPSVHEGGTVLRMDDVPLLVRGEISGPPSTEAITRALRERIVAMQDDAH